MAMTKKQFRALAIALNHAKTRISEHAEFSNIKHLNEDIMKICEESNPNFDRVRFLEVVNNTKYDSYE